MFPILIQGRWIPKLFVRDGYPEKVDNEIIKKF
jgi:hypothetical protein